EKDPAWNDDEARPRGIAVTQPMALVVELRVGDAGTTEGREEISEEALVPAIDVHARPSRPRVEDRHRHAAQEYQRAIARVGDVPRAISEPTRGLGEAFGQEWRVEVSIPAARRMLEQLHA